MATAWQTRPERDGDRAAVRRVNLAAFPTPAEADLVDALRDDPAWLPGLSYVAEAPDDAETVVAYALLTRCHVDDTPALALAPVAVLPAYQRQGAGTTVVNAVLDAASRNGNDNRTENGSEIVVVLGDPAYYGRFGFVPASRYGISPPLDWPDDAFRALPLGPTAPTGTVHYPSPFGVEPDAGSQSGTSGT